MPASEETYRAQPALHVIFAVSSIAMLLSIVWMIMADHLRPWKQVQRDFHAIEREKLKVSEQEALKTQQTHSEAEIKRIDEQIKEAQTKAAERGAELRRIEKELNGLQAKTEQLDTRRKFKKAELDSLRSLYDGMIERGEEHEAHNYLNTTVAKAEAEVGELSRELEAAQREHRF